MKNNIKITIIIVLVFIGGIGIGRWVSNKGAGAENSSIGNTVGSDEKEVTIWTCSMHPQIQSPEPGICPICEMDLTPLISDSGNDPFSLTMTENAIRLANIQTTVIGRGNSDDHEPDSWLIHGKILPDERSIYSQTPHIEGRIESLSVTYEGMYITKGSTIAEIYAPEVIAAQRELLEAKKLQHMNPNILEAARRKLRYLKISPDFIQSLEDTEEVVETFPLIAGKSGFVINKNVEPGDHVLSGQVLFDIYNLSSVWAVFDIYEKDIGKIREGQMIEFTAPGIPDQTYRTRVDFISPLLNQQSRTVRVRGQVNNQNRLLKPEMLIRGRLSRSLNQSDSDLLIPKTAVLWTGRESVVYVQDTTMEIPTFTFREITLGPESGSYYKVIEGVKAGERVVTNGVFAVDASAQLNNQRSMMNQLVGDHSGTSEGSYEMIKQVDPEIVTPEARKDLNDVLKAYVSLKDDLIQGDPEEISGSLHVVQNVSQKLQPRKDLSSYSEDWNEHVKNFKIHLELMLNENNVESWRSAFSPLSQVLIHWVLEFGNPGKNEIFVQHCPMANEDQGGDWLSYDSKIRNPYYGDAMMACGITKETLPYSE